MQNNSSAIGRALRNGKASGRHIHALALEVRALRRSCRNQGRPLSRIRISPHKGDYPHKRDPVIRGPGGIPGEPNLFFLYF